MKNDTRIKFLRQQVLDVSHAKYRIRKPLSIFHGNGNHAKPVVIRKALGFELILQEMPIFIQDSELIVGGRTLFMPRTEDMLLWDDDEV